MEEMNHLLKAIDDLRIPIGSNMIESMIETAEKDFGAIPQDDTDFLLASFICLEAILWGFARTYPNDCLTKELIHKLPKLTDKIRAAILTQYSKEELID